MIDFVYGILEYQGDNYVVIENQGVGYKIYVPTALISNFPNIGENVKVYTYLAVKEDNLELYGFLQRQQRELFSLLLTVSGIGPRVALAILSVISANDFYLAVINEDVKVLTSIPGIGRKSAQRLIFELKEKISSMPKERDEIPNVEGAVQRNIWIEVREALLLLGYSYNEIALVVKELQQEEIEHKSTEELLKVALKRLSAPGKEERLC